MALKKSQSSLKKWTREKWGYSSKDESNESLSNMNGGSLESVDLTSVNESNGSKDGSKDISLSNDVLPQPILP